MKQKREGKTVGQLMLLIVLFLYLFAALFDPSSASEALQISIEVLKTILPVMLIVLFLMTLINSYIQPEHISRYLGKHSGLKGWFIALIGGIFCHGPSYIWYPMLSELRRNGVKDSLIIAFFYARSIKVPWLPMMAGYFGIAFTLILIFYILVAAVIQGKLAEKIISSR